MNDRLMEWQLLISFEIVKNMYGMWVITVEINIYDFLNWSLSMSMWFTKQFDFSLNWSINEQ